MAADFSGHGAERFTAGLQITVVLWPLGSAATTKKDLGYSIMGQFYTRKKMRLQDYDYIQGNTVFVTVCVEDRKKLLGRILGPESAAELPVVELSEIGKTVDQFTSTIVGIDKYVIMPNHVHMIVVNAEGEDISAKLRAWKSLITRSIGESIWQRTFYDHVIRDEQDYRIRWKYIDDNPSKWAMDPYYQR